MCVFFSSSLSFNSIKVETIFIFALSSNMYISPHHLYLKQAKSKLCNTEDNLYNVCHYPFNIVFYTSAPLVNNLQGLLFICIWFYALSIYCSTCSYLFLSYLLASHMFIFTYRHSALLSLSMFSSIFLDIVIGTACEYTEIFFVCANIQTMSIYCSRLGFWSTRPTTDT